MRLGIATPLIFEDRQDAGRRLAERLSHYASRKDVVVLGLPRGGVPVAQVVARALGAPLDIILVRKLGTPGQEELAMGAIASGNVRVLNADVIDALRIPQEMIDRVAERERVELERRERAYRSGCDGFDLRGKTVILVDDGLATGATMRAALKGVRAHDPHKVVIAVPVAAPEVIAEMEALADETISLETPADFMGVGSWYRDFGQTSDAEVQSALAEANRRVAG